MENDAGPDSDLPFHPDTHAGRDKPQRCSFPDAPALAFRPSTMLVAARPCLDSVFTERKEVIIDNRGSLEALSYRTNLTIF